MSSFQILFDRDKRILLAVKSVFICVPLENLKTQN
jgi:hypothetical protein